MEKENDAMEVIILLNDSFKIKKIENVKIIKINDELYNLFIGKDYWPVIGEINGDVDIEADEHISYKNISGFYMLSHNIFHLTVKKMEE